MSLSSPQMCQATLLFIIKYCGPESQSQRETALLHPGLVPEVSHRAVLNTGHHSSCDWGDGHKIESVCKVVTALSDVTGKCLTNFLTFSFLCPPKVGKQLFALHLHLLMCFLLIFFKRQPHIHNHCENNLKPKDYTNWWPAANLPALAQILFRVRKKVVNYWLLCSSASEYLKTKTDFSLGKW